jgi:oxygen-independent coproporphyrinogen-3 oxidase
MSEEISIYIHYPFCLSKCPYCDFNSITGNVDEKRLEQCYLAEIEHYFKLIGKRTLKTIFFGGGTPSLMPPGTLSNILEIISNRWGISNNVEISIEANPTSAEINKFIEYRALGINRISIGIQSLRDEDLKFLGRTHSSTEAREAIKNAEKIFKDRYSIDLIYARPEQNLQEWLQELKKARELSPYHISLYQLTIAENTVFFRNKIHKLEEGVAATMYDETRNFLNVQGIKMYEVSNYAMDGYECEHNLNYWNSGQWLGIGAGAHGRVCFGDFSGDYLSRTSIENYKNVGRWMDAVEKNNSGAEAIEELTRDEFRQEIILMGLRKMEGINIENTKKYLKINNFDELIFDKKNLSMLLEKKCVEVSNNYFRISGKYFNVLDSVIEKLL